MHAARSPFVLLLLLLSSSSVFATLRCFESDLLDATIKQGVAKLRAPVTGSSRGIFKASTSSKTVTKGRVAAAKVTPVVKTVVPAIKIPTASTLEDGATKAVSQFSNSNLLTKEQSDKLSAALAAAIKAQLAAEEAAESVQTFTLTRVLTRTALGAVSTQTLTVTNNGTITATATAAPELITVTEVATSTLTADSAAGSAAAAAALNIKAAIDSAFAAVNLAQGDLSAETVADLEACLTTVLAAGGMPDGFACLSESGSTAAGLQATLDTTLSQFVGILPNIIIENLFAAVSSSLGALLPSSESALIAQIEASIKSVIATMSGSSATALIQAGNCYTAAIQLQGNTSSMECFATGALKTLQTAQIGVMESFVGVLPASLMTSVQNIIAYNFANSGDSSPESLAAQVQAQISNAINSAASTLSGNTVTLANILQSCTTQLILTGNATLAQECITQGSAPQVSQTLILGIAEQFTGYLPSSFFSSLISAASPLLSNSTSNPTGASAAEIANAFDSFFNNATSYGPAYGYCIAQVQKCVTEAFRAGGTLEAVCAGPVEGCELPARRKRSLGEETRTSEVVVEGMREAVEWLGREGVEGKVLKALQDAVEGFVRKEEAEGLRIQREKRVAGWA